VSQTSIEALPFCGKHRFSSAQHLRAKDRTSNKLAYPKIHYPELYILEGGYSAYFKLFGALCEPPAYVRMDEADCAIARRRDLNQFREIECGRHKSYAHNERDARFSTRSSKPQRCQLRDSMPTSSLLLAATNVARGRRANPPSTVREDVNTTMEADDTDTDIDDSPCRPPARIATLKGRHLARIR
jgi:M-phase inducer tyrosine phosphatase